MGIACVTGLTSEPLVASVNQKYIASVVAGSIEFAPPDDVKIGGTNGAPELIVQAGNRDKNEAREFVYWVD